MEGMGYVHISLQNTSEKSWFAIYQKVSEAKDSMQVYNMYAAGTPSSCPVRSLS
jgi:hypothetical protein